VSLGSGLGFLIIGLSALKIVVGITGGLYLLMPGGQGLSIIGVTAVGLMVAFTTGGLFLLNGRRRDPRAVDLAVLFFLVATSFADGFAGPLQRAQWLGGVLTAGRAVQPEAFLPYFAWRFFGAFPRVRTVSPDRVAWWGRISAGWVGAFLFLATMFVGILPS